MGRRSLICVVVMLSAGSSLPIWAQTGRDRTPPRTAWRNQAQDESQKEPPPAERQEAGRAHFERVCRVCHGPEARGDTGPQLVPFTREYEELLAIVREGAGQMPPISARTLPDEGVAQIVAYLRSLSR